MHPKMRANFKSTTPQIHNNFASETYWFIPTSLATNLHVNLVNLSQKFYIRVRLIHTNIIYINFTS